MKRKQVFKLFTYTCINCMIIVEIRFYGKKNKGKTDKDKLG